jgi:hypothetical protein
MEGNQDPVYQCVTSRRPDRPGRYTEQAPWHKNGQDNDHHTY